MILENSWTQLPTCRQIIWNMPPAALSVSSKWQSLGVGGPHSYWTLCICRNKFTFSLLCSVYRIVDVKCYPIPNALNPCEDVMGSQWLRFSVWMVVFLAVFGNIAVLLVMFSNWNDVTVPKFLMSHLAFADLCLGLYLMLIAAIDVHTMGEYFNFAFDWQYGELKFCFGRRTYNDISSKLILQCIRLAKPFRNSIFSQLCRV